MTLRKEGVIEIDILSMIDIYMVTALDSDLLGV